MYKSNDLTNSVKAMKEGGYIQIALNLTRLTSPCMHI